MLGFSSKRHPNVTSSIYTDSYNEDVEEIAREITYKSSAFEDAKKHKFRDLKCKDFGFS